MNEQESLVWSAMVDLVGGLEGSDMKRSAVAASRLFDAGQIVGAVSAAASLSSRSPDAAVSFSRLPRRLLSIGRTDLAIPLTREILRHGSLFPDPEVVAALISSAEPEHDRKELAALMRSQPPHWSLEHAFRHRFRFQQAPSLEVDREVVICEGADHREQLSKYFKGTNHPIEPAIRWMTPSLPVKIYHQKNCILHVYKGGFLLLDEKKTPYKVFSSYVFNEYLKKINISQINDSFEKLFFCGDIYGPANYFIWMANYFPRVAVAAEFVPGFDIAMENTPEKSFQRQTLQFLGIPDDAFHRLNPGNYFIKNFSVLSTNTIDYVHCFHGGSAQYADFAIKNIPISGHPSPELIFVTRARGLSRSLSNSEEIEKYLHSRGFHTIDAGNYSVSDQANIFRKAKAIVGVHGAALANLMFCLPGTKILELLSPIGGSPSFGRISAMLGLDYSLLIGETQTKAGSLSTENNLQDFSVEFEKFKVRVEKMLDEHYQGVC